MKILKKIFIMSFILFLGVSLCSCELIAQAVGLKYELSEDGTYSVTDCYENITKVKIPKKYLGKPVTIIGEDAFADCSRLTNIVIPDSVTSIGNYAFSDCSSLKTVYYTGTEAEWGKISIESNNDNLKNAKIIYNYSN